MTSIRVLALVLLAAFGSACANGAPSPAICAVIGGVAGAGAGAGIGAAGEDDDEEIYAGAGIGGVLGAAVGYLVCRALAEEPPPPPPPPAPAPPPPPPPPPPEQEKIVLRGVNFDFDKSDIRADAAVILDEAAAILNRNAGVRVRVGGHTDWIGTDAYNQGLSERRAESVRRYLVDRGVSADRLETAGFGESQPIATNETKEGRALNRRVELTVLN